VEETVDKNGQEPVVGEQGEVHFQLLQMAGNFRHLVSDQIAQNTLKKFLRLFSTGNFVEIVFFPKKPDQPEHPTW